MTVVINKVGVIGSGTMATGIIEVFARSGYEVVSVTRGAERSATLCEAFEKSKLPADFRAEATKIKNKSQNEQIAEQLIDSMTEGGDIVEGMLKIAEEQKGTENGEQALRAVQSFGVPIRLLVTDVVLPVVGGRELADKLMAAQPSVRVLYMSGYTDDEVVRHGVEANRVHFLQKPFTPLALTRRVREILDAPR